VPVAPTFNEYAEKVAVELRDSGFSAQADAGDERMNAKIRNAQGRKAAYMLVVGGKEAEEGLVSARTRDGRQLAPMKIKEFADYLTKVVAEKSQSL
jgi:threonyl-tRNA synthetase